MQQATAVQAATRHEEVAPSTSKLEYDALRPSL